MRATAEGEGGHFHWGLWNTGIRSRFPSLQQLLPIFSWRSWRKFWQKSFPISPIDWTLIPSFSYSPHSTCTPLSNSYDFYMQPNMILVLYMWFLQGLIFTIINHSHNQFHKICVFIWLWFFYFITDSRSVAITRQQIWALVLAVVVTVLVQLSVPDLQWHFCDLIYSIPIT